MDLVKTGLFISALRKEKGMTQKDLAEKIGVTDKAVSRWETGKGFPDVSLLTALAEMLGISVSEIVMGERIEIEQKDTAEIMNTMNKTVVDALDYSQQEANKKRWKNIMVTSIVLLGSVFILYCVFMIVYDRLFWRMTPHVPINDVLYTMLVFLAIPIAVPMIANSIKDKQTRVKPSRFLWWVSPLAAFVLLMIATAVFYPRFYSDLVNVEMLRYDFNDTSVDDVLFYLVPINLLITLSVTAICYAGNRMKMRVK
jgi:transcriptional regulator with XRE-family HTH domain